jgi:hypothetical protein
MKMEKTTTINAAKPINVCLPLGEIFFLDVRFGSSAKAKRMRTTVPVIRMIGVRRLRPGVVITHHPLTDHILRANDDQPLLPGI